MSLGNAKGPIRKRKQRVHTHSRETITDRERLLTEIDLKPRRSGELGRPTERHHLAITAAVAPLQAPSHAGDAVSWPAMCDQTRGPSSQRSELLVALEAPQRFVVSSTDNSELYAR